MWVGVCMCAYARAYVREYVCAYVYVFVSCPTTTWQPVSVCLRH